VIEIGPARTDADVADAKNLFLEYAGSLGFSLCFQGFDEEVATLPGRYAPPGGGLFLARGRTLAEEDEGLAGCVALRALEERGVAEMKRLYVRDRYRGTGLGRRLAERVLEEARGAGYAKMRLDTLPTMVRAIPMYRKLGFREIAAYTLNPVEGALFFEKTL
jgi:ribosomal protein S18 acetylase RimI-like enzyme